MVEAKLADAKTADRVSALKAEKAIEAADVSGSLRKQLEDVADTQIKAQGSHLAPHGVAGRQVGVDAYGNRARQADRRDGLDDL